MKSVNHFPAPNDPELYQEILGIVNDASGGIKFTELMTKLAVSRQGKIPDTEKFIHDVEYLCRHSDELKVLTYTYKLLNREKMFIHTV